MYHPDDRELDRLSAAAGEHYTPPGNPNWDALEQTLDKELPQKKDKRRRGLIWFFLLPGLFIAGAAYWYTRPAGNPTAPIAINSNNGAKPGNNMPNASTPGATANTNINTNERPLLPAPKRSTASANKNENTNKNTIDANKADRTNYVNSLNPTNNTKDASNRLKEKKTADIAYQPLPSAGNNEKQSLLGPAAKKRTNGLLNTNKTNNHITGKTSLAQNNRKGGDQPAGMPTNDNAGDISRKSNDQATGTDQPTTTQKDAPPVTNPVTSTGPGASTPPAKDSLQNDTPAPKKQDSAQVDNKHKNNPLNPKHSEKAFSIGITGGVDMSTVKFNYSSNAGYNIGVMAGYHFSEHWSVYTGAIYTKKNYKLEGYNYHAPDNSWIAMYNVKIDEVNGNCNMWELPLIGRYTFGARTNTASRFFMSAGISSYLMNREYYSYDYKRNGNPTTAEWTNTKHSEFWFSVLDFSAGIEKPLGHHLVGQLEPYAKLPLSGLGTGKIMLSSFGVNVTLQYRKKLGK